MNSALRQHVFPGVSFLVFLVGLGMALGAFGHLGKTETALRRKSQSLSELAQIQKDLDRFLLAREAFAALPSPTLSPAADAVGRGSTGLRATDVRQNTEELADGWALRLCELSFREASVARVMKGVAEAERCRPPWRLVRFLARASARDAGLAQVVVELEGIERTGSSD